MPLSAAQPKMAPDPTRVLKPRQRRIGGKERLETGKRERKRSNPGSNSLFSEHTHPVHDGQGEHAAGADQGAQGDAHENRGDRHTRSISEIGHIIRKIRKLLSFLILKKKIKLRTFFNFPSRLFQDDA